MEKSAYETIKFFDELTDYLFDRISLAAVSGAAIGISSATLKGIPIFRPTIQAAASSALAATACFGAERAANALVHLYDGNVEVSERKSGDYRSHLAGGVIGGSIVGFLYIHRPITGVLFFSPIMLGVNLIERKMVDYKDKRIELLKTLENDRAFERRDKSP